MTEKEVSDLLKRYEAGECNKEEQLMVHSWYDHLDALSVDAKPTLPVRKRVKLMYYWSAAAAVLVVFTSLFYLLNRGTAKKEVYTYNKTLDIPAGGNKAVLTLANGNQINLDDTLTGAIANQSGVTVMKNKNGQIVYNVSSAVSQGDKELQYNTISTPNGGQYQVILPDGSLVFLNAASSLKYPIQFTKNERKVNLTGEAYFQVTKDVKRPFVVTSQGQQVKVLGTQFNISVYPSETIKTTLVEGSVELTSSFSLQKQLLKPDQQALLLSNNQGFKVMKVIAAEETAWKDGLFIFRQSSIADVLHHFCRWYNVEADFSNLPDTKLNADLSRTATLQDIINVLNFTNSNKGIKFKITDGMKLEIIKN